MGSMIFLALIVICVSGLIAYVGDLVGRKMGRKRLTLMGLRPRHTAIVISVSVGMFIALLTLLATLTVNRGVREAFFTPLDKVKAELAAKTQAVKDTRVALSDMESDLSDARAQLQEQQEKLVASAKKRAEIERALTSAQTLLRSVEAKRRKGEQQLRYKQRELSTANAELAKAKTAYRLAKNEVATAKTELEKVKAELAQVKGEYTRVSGEYQRVDTEYQRVTAEYQRVSDEYARVSKDLESKKLELAAATKSLIERAQEEQNLKNEIDALEDNILLLDERANDLEQKRQLLEQKAQVLTVFARVGFSPLSFTYGQEIVSGLIPPGITEKARKRWLEQYIDIAEQIVRQRSKDLAANEAALLFLPGNTEKLEFVPRREVIDQLSARIAALEKTDGVIIRLAPMNNVPINGPALIALDQITLVPSAIAYRKGDIVARAEMVITDTTTTADIVKVLADELLREQLPAALRAKEVLSISRRFDASHPETIPNPDTPTASWADLISAAEAARLLHGKIMLVVRANADVTTYGPLAIEIDAIPAQ